MRLLVAAGLTGMLALSACGRQELEDLNATSRVERGEPQAGAGLYSSLAVDESGRPHIAYYHADLQALRYARWQKGAWRLETVDGGEGQDRGSGARLAMVGETPMVAYFAEDEREIRLAARTAEGTWKIETVSPEGSRPSSFLDLAVLRGKPVVAWYEAGKGNLILSRKGKDGWSSTVVSSEGDVGQYVSIVASLDGGLHLSFYDADRGGLLYAQVATDETVMVEEVDGFVELAEEGDDPVIDSDDVGVWTRIAVHPAKGGDPRIAAPKIVYQDRLRGRLLLAERTMEGKWTRTVVDDRSFTGSDSDLLWLHGQDLVIAYLDGANLDLQLARRRGDSWHRQTLLSQGAVGFYNSLARLGGGRLALTTWNMSAGELLYLTVPERP